MTRRRKLAVVAIVALLVGLGLNALAEWGGPDHLPQRMDRPDRPPHPRSIYTPPGWTP